MGEVLTSDDPRYRTIFDAAAEARESGYVVGDLTPQMNALRNRATVHKGSLRELLELPEPTDAAHAEHQLSVQRQPYTAFSYKICDAAFRDNETYSSTLYLEMAIVQAFGDVILSKVGDDHKRLRAVAQPMFIAPKAMTWWRDNWIDSVVTSLLDAIEGQDEADLNLDLCARLPVNVITRGIGIEAEQALDFREHLLRATMSRSATAEQKAHSMSEVVRMLKAAITARRENAGDDVLSGLVTRDFEQPDGSVRKLTDVEIFSYCRLIMFAGGGTTWRQLGITINALLTHEGNWEALVKDRSLVEDAVQESVRFLPTDPVFPRLVTKDVELDGVLVPKGSSIELCLGAANRDPERWANPDVFDIFRPKQTNLGFGVGPHQCLGQHVARQEMYVALLGLLDRFPKLRLNPKYPKPEVTGGLEMRGISALPVILR